MYMHYNIIMIGRMYVSVVIWLLSYPMSPGLCGCCIIGFAFSTPAAPGGGTERGPGGERGTDPGFGASRGVVSFVEVFHQYTRSLPSGSFTATQGSSLSFCSAGPTREEPRLGAREKHRTITPPSPPPPSPPSLKKEPALKRDFCLAGQTAMAALDKFLKSLLVIFLFVIYVHKQLV